MKTKKYKQFEAVTSTTIGGFAEALNSAIKRHGIEGDPEIVWQNNLSCLLAYYDTEREAETVKDQYELRGERYICRDCPYLGKQEDMRRKAYPCLVYGHTVPRNEACDYFYEQLARHEIEPITVEL